MVFTGCPICGMQAHLNVSDPEAWYKANPVVLANGLPAGLCIYCWRGVKRGRRVKLWRVPNNAPSNFRGVVGDIGVVDAVNGEPDGETIELKDFQALSLPQDTVQIRTEDDRVFEAPRDCLHVLS